jgi:hypothetical protein
MLKSGTPILVAIAAFAFSSAAWATEIYPPDEYYPFGTVVFHNETHLDDKGNPTGLWCGNFNLASDLTGMFPSTFQGGGGKDASMIVSLEYMKFDPTTEQTVFNNFYGGSVALEYENAQGGKMIFDAGVDQNGGEIDDTSFPFSVLDMKIGKGMLTLSLDVDFSGCTVGLDAVFYE